MIGSSSGAHVVAVAFGRLVVAITRCAALAHVPVVVDVDAVPEIPGHSVTILPPRLFDAS